jgi:hypothetical protein
VELCDIHNLIRDDVGLKTRKRITESLLSEKAKILQKLADEIGIKIIP